MINFLIMKILLSFPSNEYDAKSYVIIIIMLVKYLIKMINQFQKKNINLFKNYKIIMNIHKINIFKILIKLIH